jgi:hypothetical protein
MSASKERYQYADDRQESLFDAAPDWREHWRGMPEFEQRKQEPYQKIIVRFSCKEDVDDFAARLGQRVTAQTVDLWHPALVVKRLTDRVITG